MVRGAKKPEYMKSVVGPTLGLLALLGIASYALLGPTGIIAWTDYRAALSERKIELAKLQKNGTLCVTGNFFWTETT